MSDLERARQKMERLRKRKENALKRSANVIEAVCDKNSLYNIAARLWIDAMGEYLLEVFKTKKLVKSRKNLYRLEDFDIFPADCAQCKHFDATNDELRYYGNCFIDGEYCGRGYVCKNYKGPHEDIVAKKIEEAEADE